MTEHREAVDAGAYVLGSLRGADRDTFERHLVTCSTCQDAVSELAVLPPLLGTVPPDVVARLGEGAPDAPDLPTTILPSVLERVRTEEARRRRRRALAGAVSLAAVLLLGVVLVLRPGLATTPAPAPSLAVTALTLEPADDVPLIAEVRFEEVAWGTRIGLDCAYEGDGSYLDGGTPREYALVLTRRDGATEQVATWRASAGGEVTVPAATGTAVEEITRVELQDAGGRALMVGNL